MINDDDDNKIGCGYYSKARDMVCGKSRINDNRGHLPFFYCFDCKRKIYHSERKERAFFNYNQCLKDVENILNMDISYEEKVKRILDLKKNDRKE